jgi:hypothetical protein
MKKKRKLKALPLGSLVNQAFVVFELNLAAFSFFHFHSVHQLTPPRPGQYFEATRFRYTDQKETPKELRHSQLLSLHNEPVRPYPHASIFQDSQIQDGPK